MKENYDFFKGTFESWLDFNTRMMQQSMDMAKNAWSPEGYEKFYRMWSQSMSEMMERMMKTPGFAEKSWEAFKTTAGFQKFNQMLTQTYLKNMNLPTREEFEELSERMNYLDDRIEELEGRLKEMSEKKKKTTRKTTKKTTKKKKTESKA